MNYNESLIAASQNGNLNAVKNAIQSGANINYTNQFGETALHHASYQGFTEITKLLLENKALIDIQSNNELLTALMLAADNGRKECVQILLQYGANTELRSQGLRTAYDYSRLKNFTEIMELLKPKEDDLSNIKIKQIKINNAEADKQLIQAIWNDNIDLLIHSLENGANINPPKDKDQPLIIATLRGKTEQVKLLIKHGANVNATDTAGISALAKACGACFVEIAKYLIENGAEVTNNVVIAASIHKNPQILKLIKKGQARMGTPRLSNKDEDNNKLIYNAAEGNFDELKNIIKNGANINSQDQDGATALFWTSRKGNIQIAQYLLENKADPNIKTLHGWTALMEASFADNNSIVKLLLENGAEVNAITEEGASALMMAASEGNLSIIETLLKNGADKNLQIKSGVRTGKKAFEIAWDAGQMDALKLLQ